MKGNVSIRQVAVAGIKASRAIDIVVSNNAVVKYCSSTVRYVGGRKRLSGDCYTFELGQGLSRGSEGDVNSLLTSVHDSRYRPPASMPEKKTAANSDRQKRLTTAAAAAAINNVSTNTQQPAANIVTALRVVLYDRASIFGL